MAQWTLVGWEKRSQIEREIEPMELKNKLNEYRKALGKDFSIHDLLMVEDIRSKAVIAEALNNMPEYLLHEIGKMRNEHEVRTIAGALDGIEDVLLHIGNR